MKTFHYLLQVVFCMTLHIITIIPVHVSTEITVLQYQEQTTESTLYWCSRTCDWSLYFWGGKKKYPGLYFGARTEMASLQAFCLQHSWRVKNLIILSWALDVEIHSLKSKISDVIYFEGNVNSILKYKQEDNSENRFDQSSKIGGKDTGT